MRLIHQETRQIGVDRSKELKITEEENDWEKWKRKKLKQK